MAWKLSDGAVKLVDCAVSLWENFKETHITEVL